MASLGEHRILMEEEQMERMATLATVSLSSLNLQVWLNYKLTGLYTIHTLWPQ
jgi:hypothetical protein